MDLVASPDVGDAFRVELSRQGNCVVASAFGEIDLTTAPALIDAIESDLGPTAPTCVVIDLSEVRFLDSSGLNALVRLQRTLEGRGTTMRLVSPSDGIIRQVFEITELVEPLRVVDSLDDALA
jgi:anti-sigma B factor antagonist